MTEKGEEKTKETLPHGTARALWEHPYSGNSAYPLSGRVAQIVS